MPFKTTYYASVCMVYVKPLQTAVVSHGDRNNQHYIQYCRLISYGTKYFTNQHNCLIFRKQLQEEQTCN